MQAWQYVLCYGYGRVRIKNTVTDFYNGAILYATKEFVAVVFEGITRPLHSTEITPVYIETMVRNFYIPEGYGREDTVAINLAGWPWQGFLDKYPG